MRVPSISFIVLDDFGLKLHDTRDVAHVDYYLLHNKSGRLATTKRMEDDRDISLNAEVNHCQSQAVIERFTAF